MLSARRVFVFGLVVLVGPIVACTTDGPIDPSGSRSTTTVATTTVATSTTTVPPTTTSVEPTTTTTTIPGPLPPGSTTIPSTTTTSIPVPITTTTTTTTTGPSSTTTSTTSTTSTSTTSTTSTTTSTTTTIPAAPGFNATIWNPGYMTPCAACHACRDRRADACNFAVARSVAGNPGASNFWLKPTGQVAHGGGTIHAVGSAGSNAIATGLTAAPRRRDMRRPDAALPAARSSPPERDQLLRGRAW